MVFFKLDRNVAEPEEGLVGVRLRPGPVMVCGPPGTEPVEGRSQTRFDDNESLVYSRVSVDMSITPGYIHKSGSLKHIPPKDTPSLTAEVFARPSVANRRYVGLVSLVGAGSFCCTCHLQGCI